MEEATTGEPTAELQRLIREQERDARAEARGRTLPRGRAEAKLRDELIVLAALDAGSAPLARHRDTKRRERLENERVRDRGRRRYRLPAGVSKVPHVEFERDGRTWWRLPEPGERQHTWMRR